MKTIYKYELSNTTSQTLEMPKHAKILCVQVQNEVPCVWAEVETDNPTGKRNILIVGTGKPIPSNPKQYIGTFQLYNGELVFHVFELE